MTDRLSNLYAELIERLGRTDPAIDGDPSPVYAMTMRRRRVRGGKRRAVLDTWYTPLHVGQSLPTLHLWLSDTAGVRLDLEATYADTCRPVNIR